MKNSVQPRDFPAGPEDKTPRSQCRGPGSIPSWGTRSHMLQLRVHMPQLKIPHASTKDPTQHNKDQRSNMPHPIPHTAK